MIDIMNNKILTILYYIIELLKCIYKHYKSYNKHRL